MNGIQIFILILQAIIALPKIGSMVERWVANFKAWQNRKDEEKRQQAVAAVTKAAEATRSAQSKEDRINAAKQWQEALKKPRPDRTP